MRFDIKTVSEANQREHWAAKSKRKKQQQRDFSILWRQRKGCNIEPPSVVTFTRHACRVMDSDNLAGAFKHIRDQLAREIGIDDGDERVHYRYDQKRIPKREHYFTVDITNL